MSNIVDLVARNCDLSEKEARKEIESFRESVLDGSISDPFDAIVDYLGIEPDYLMDILCFEVMAQRVTLRQAVEILKQQGIDIEWNDLTLEDFFSYFDHTYKTDCENGTFPKVSFFFTDILEIFK